MRRVQDWVALLRSRLYPRTGSFLSVALSLRLPWAGVTRHPVSVEPGLSSVFIYHSRSGLLAYAMNLSASHAKAAIY